MIKRIIFVDNDGSSRSVLAGQIFEKNCQNKYEVIERGLIVPFSEPINPKVAAVMASDGIEVTDFISRQLTDEDITSETIIFAIDGKCKDGIISAFENASEENTFEICSFSGEELEIINPYGGTLTTYGICYESLKNVVSKLIKNLEENYE